MIETERRFTTASGQMAYLDEGDGPAVVLVHGFPTSSFLWREFVPLLAGRSRVIVPDLLGSGDSTVSEGVSLDLRTQADAVAALLADLGVDRFAVVGHGVGGGVAQLLALDDLGADAMVLLDAVAFDAWPWPLLDAARQADVMSDADMEMSIRSSIEAGLPHGSRLPDAVLDGYVRPWRTGDGGARFARVLAGLDGTGLAEREQELADIAFPVLILWGEDDPFLPAGGRRTPQRGDALFHPGTLAGLRAFPAGGGSRHDRADDRRVPAGALPDGAPRTRPEERRGHAAARTPSPLGGPGRR